MALCNLATKMRRMPAAAAPRLPSPPSFLQRRVLGPSIPPHRARVNLGILNVLFSVTKILKSASVEKLLSMSQSLREGFDRRIVTLRQSQDEFAEVMRDLSRLSMKFVSATITLSLLAWLAKSEDPVGPNESGLEEV